MADYNEPKMQDVPDDSEEFELGHTDKLVGVFTSPSETFGKISNFPPKVIDWFLPMFMVILVAVFANFVKLSNPVINVEYMQKQREVMAKSFESAVNEKKMTQEDADQKIDSMLAISNGPIGKGIAVVGGLIVGFIVFFIMAGIYYLIVRFGLKGNGTYSYALVSFGLASYILILQQILATVFSLLTSRLAGDFSAASLAGLEKTTIAGLALSFVDPVSIWFYFVFGIALAKTFKSENSRKYIITIFAMWVGFTILFFALSKVVPFFQNFVR